MHIGNISTGKVKLYCDNKSALENVFDSEPKRGIYPLLAVDYDLLVLAKDLLRALPIQVSSAWVKSQYTGDNREIQHDLNALVDTLATDFQKAPPEGYEPTVEPSFHPLQVAAQYRGGSMITSKLSKKVYECRFEEKLIQTIAKRACWAKEEFQRVDWDIFGRVFNS